MRMRLVSSQRREFTAILRIQDASALGALE
jgi:hypothetical protein